MHELSLAQSVVDIIHQYVPDHRRPFVRTVSMRIGAVSGVVADSLVFCFTAVTAGSALEGAALQVEHVPYVIRCGACGTTAEAEPGFRPCPSCGSVDTTVQSGTELNVTEIELSDEEEDHQ